MADDPETTGADRPDRDGVSGRFLPGNPGRPRGSRHQALLALDAIGADNASAVMQAVVNAAKGGDMRAADILLRRLWPERKGRPVELDMPALTSAAGVTAALAAVVSAVAGGELSPEEGQAVAAILEAQRRAIETADLEARIAALEARNGHGGRA
jgi:hypothetical protein